MNEKFVFKWMLRLAAIVPLATYATTLCRTIYWGDGIELTCAAAVLGVAHPTGYPLFTLLGKLFAQLPLGTIAFRLNLMSAVTASILAALVAWTFWRLWPLLGFSEPEKFPGRRGAHAPLPRLPHADRALVRAAFSVGAGWAVAFGQSPWYDAGLTEVYLLNAAIFAGVFGLIVRTLAEHELRWFWAACLVCAVGIGNHTMAGVLLIPALVGLAVWFALKPDKRAVHRRRRSRWIDDALLLGLARIAGPALLLGLLGVGIYAYLPLRAVRNPPLNWGDPSTVGRFLWSVRAGEFRRNYFLKVPQWLYPDRAIPAGTPFSGRTYPAFLNYRLAELMHWAGDQVTELPSERTRLAAVVGILILFAAAMGWRIVLRRQPAFAAFLAVVLGMNLAAVFVYSIPDIDGYFFPLYLVWVLCAVAAAAQLHRWTELRLLVHRSDLLAYLFVAFLIAACSHARALCDHSHYDAPERYGREVLDRLPADAMILTRGDYDIYPLWYQQIVEHRRRDVVVCGSNFLATPGYGKYFDRRYQPPVALTFFEQTPEEQTYFQVLAGEIIAPNLRLRPLYATWYDPRMGVAGDPLELAVLREEKVMAVEERRYFPPPFLYRLRAPGGRP